MWLYNYVHRRVLFSCAIGAATLGLAACISGGKLLLVTSVEGLHVVNTLLGSVVERIAADQCSGVATWVSGTRCAVAVGTTVVFYDVGR